MQLHDVFVLICYLFLVLSRWLDFFNWVASQLLDPALYLNPIFEIGPLEPRYSEYILFEGISG